LAKAMKNSPDVLGNGSGNDERFAGQLGYRGAQRRDGLGLPEQSIDRNGTPQDLDDMSTMPTMLEPPPVSSPSMSLTDLDSLSEPVFPPMGWLDDSPTGTLADHPLLRGLLLELPPKGTIPAPGWLDRWFDAARSILELLYIQNAGGNPRR
jgi:hypothetical protein